MVDYKDKVNLKSAVIRALKASIPNSKHEERSMKHVSSKK